jgi:type IV pilus assembly protein PilV
MMTTTIHTAIRHAHVANQRGFTLLEIMIAVLVLAVGLLGMAGLQATGIRNNLSAYQRSQANYLAYDIIDRMRVNRAAAESAGNPYDLAPDDDLGAPTNCHTANCDAAALAAFDLYEWTRSLANNLPDGAGSITRLTVSGRTIFRVIVQWDSSRTADGGDAGDAGITNIQVEAEL